MRHFVLSSFVHGRLPYDVLLKPDPVLRGILQSLPVRKLVSFLLLSFNGEISTLEKPLFTPWCMYDDMSILGFPLQIFTNADSKHAIRALKTLGLEDCFESIISFDTLNPSNTTNPSHNKDGSESRSTTAEIFDFCEHIRRAESDMVLPRTPVVCKPFDDAFGNAFKLADIDPPRAVRIWTFPSFWCSCSNLRTHLYKITNYLYDSYKITNY